MFETLSRASWLCGHNTVPRIGDNSGSNPNGSSGLISSLIEISHSSFNPTCKSIDSYL